MAEATGFRTLYLSGGGVAANSLRMPDLGISTMEDVLTDVRRITDVTTLPLLVDIDTGWGGAFNTARTIRYPDQGRRGRRAHGRPGRQQALRSSSRQGGRLDRGDGRPATGRGGRAHRFELRHHGPHRLAYREKVSTPRWERVRAYVEVGADMIFAEAVTDLKLYASFREVAGVPVLANITEFGHTPLYTKEELAAAGADMVLHSCSAYRAVNAAALKVYQSIGSEGTQSGVLDSMQTRAELYDFLGYHEYDKNWIGCSPQQSRPPVGASDERSRSCAGAICLQTQKVGRPFRHCRGKHRALHCRPQRQRPALPRLRHPRPRVRNGV